MTTVDEARAALAAADAQMNQSIELAGRAVPLLTDVFHRITDEGSDALGDLTEFEAMAVRAAIVFVLNINEVAHCNRLVANAIAETN